MRSIRRLAKALSIKLPLGRHFWADRTGSAAAMTAFASTALLGFMAIGVDGTHFYLTRRQLQAATDLAAIAAVSNADAGASVAAAAMASNGFPGAAIRVTPGRYVADPSLPPSARFSAGPGGNAIEVTATSRDSFIFGAAFRTLVGDAQAASGNAVVDGVAIRTRAVARRQDTAAFTLGSGLAALDGGILNGVLGGLLGTRLSLGLLDYHTLADANLDLFSLADGLAARGLVSGPSYGAATTSLVTQSNLLNAMADSLQGGTPAAAALRWIALAVPPGTSINLAKLIDFGPASGFRIGTTHPLTARVSALDMLLAFAELGGQNRIVAVDFGTSIPGLLSAKLQLTVGEPAVGTRFFTVGAEGTTLHTAQVRLLLTTGIGGNGLPVNLTVPLYLELAPASATLAGIACTSGAANATVTLSVTPGLADLWIGAVQPGDFGGLAAPPTVTRATLATAAGLMRLDALGHATLSQTGASSLDYSAADIKAGTVKTISSGPSLAALLDNLIGATQISVTALGATLPQAQMPKAVTGALTASLTPLDALVSRTLSLLGISVGRASAAVTGLRCGQGVLVN